MRKVVFLGGFGLLPLWAAIVAVYLGSLPRSAPSEYWNVAPWLIVAAVPLCGVTLAIAFLTLSIYKRTAGDPSRKFRIAATSFLSLVLAVGAIAAFLWIRDEDRQQNIKNEQSLVLEFVKNDQFVIQTVGERFRASIASTAMSNGLPIKYEIWISADRKKARAIVSVSRTSGRPVFALTCLTPPHVGRHDPLKEPCKQVSTS